MAILQCTNPKCNFVFNEEKEDQKFNDLTEEWVCPNPNCRSIKDSFSEIEEEHIEPADEEKKSGTPEDEQDLEKKQNPEDKLDLEKKQNLEDEQDLEKKEDPEDRKSPQMTKGRRKRAQIKDFKDENGI